LQRSNKINSNLNVQNRNNKPANGQDANNGYNGSNFRHYISGNLAENQTMYNTRQKYIDLNNNFANQINNDMNKTRLRNRLSIDINSKSDFASNRQHALLNNYRIRSALNLAKQRSTGN
jgi:hypothetical protein